MNERDAPPSPRPHRGEAVIGRAFRWSLAVFALVGAVVAAGVYLARREPPPPPAVEQTPVAAPRAAAAPVHEPPALPFTDVTREAGIDFRHVSGAHGERLLPETMGSGAAFFDYDGDGDPDLLLVNSEEWPAEPVAPASRLGSGAPPEGPGKTPARGASADAAAVADAAGTPGRRPTLALYRNDTVTGGKGPPVVRFTDVTREAGLAVSLYGMGVATGDYDGDGRVDVFVTAVGPNRLFRNQGDGSFREVTEQAGVTGAADAWSTGAAFFDYDGDGDLDLFVGNYVRWSREIDLQVDFRLTGIGRAYGPPTAFEGAHPYLYRNQGDGTFADVSAAAGVQVANPATGRPVAKALGVAPVDLDGDGRLDLLVANDTVQNFLLRNRGDGTFEEIGTAAGVAFDRDGAATGAMGIDTARYRNDEALAVAIGNFANEMTSFYVTQGVPDLLADEAIQAGIGPASRQALTFGLFFFDADLDGQIDLLQANGHLEAEINQVQPSQHYAQPAQLFWNCGPDCPAAYVPVPGQRLGDLARPMVGRGATYADVDGDGDLDVLLTENGGPPRLLRNDQALGHHWLRVRLLGRAPNPDAIGARVELTAGGVTQYRQVMPARSYLSQVELPVTFGLGQSAAVERLRVTWPDGSAEDVPVEGVDRLVTVRQAGAGPAATAVPTGPAPATPPGGSPPTAPAAASVPTPAPPAAPAATPPPAAAAEGDGFVEIAGASGLDFVQFNGMSGEWYLVENLGGGAALLDYDGDGDLDVFLVQGEMLGPKPLSAALFPPQPGKPPGARLYRNDLTVSPDGRRALRFTDVTGQSGIRDTGYGMGVAAADYDNDGHADLYLTNLGPNQLWRNRGDGTFVNVTAEAGTGEPRLSVSAAFLDYDRDGRLDLFVGNYVDFSPDHNRPCYAPWSARDYCSPKVYRALPDTLYRNRGDGTFEDVSVKTRVAQEAGTALGVVAADFNGDGWADVYVANDGMANHLWMNQKDGTFVNDALLAGAAVNREGMAEASMGVDAGDVDGDGDEDLFMTHLAGETNTLYLNNGDGWFEDRSVQSGLAGPSKAYTSFGTAFFDYDNDGDLDLFVASGAVNIIQTQAEAGDPYPLRQTKQLFENLGDGRFRDVTAQAGAALQVPEVSRGVAFGDLDNDGDTDLVVVNNNGPARLLENRLGTRSHWLGLRLIGREGRDAVGARVALERAGQPTLWRRVRADGSYACANDPRVLVGLGPAADVREVRVHWPDGTVESFAGLPADRYHTLRQGTGRPAAPQ